MARKRGHLLAMGLALGMLLPLTAVVLIASEYRQSKHQRQIKTHLLADAVERQLQDRMLLLGRQLDAAADDPSSAKGAVIGMRDLTVRPVRPDDRMVPDRLMLDPPVRISGRWYVRASWRDKGHVARALVDIGLFNDVVGGFTLSHGDVISVLHDSGVIIARSSGDPADTGRPVGGAALFTPRWRNAQEGEYDEASVIDGENRHHYFRRLNEVPLDVMVGARQHSLLSVWGWPAAATLFFAFVIAGAWAWLVRRFVRAQDGQARLIGRLESSLGATTRAEERLRQAHALVRLGEYEWDPASGLVSLFGDSVELETPCADSATLQLDQALGRVHADDRPRLLRLARVILDNGQPVETHYRVVEGNGHERHVFTRATRATTDDGRIVVRGVYQDLTELFEARERAERAEADYRFLFEHNPLPMWVFDRDSLSILAVNDAMLAHYGYSRAELVGASMLVLRPPDDAGLLEEAVRSAARDRPQGHVWTHLHKSGRVLRTAIFSHDIAFEGHNARLVSAQDVTEREQADQRFRLVARATSDAVYDYDLDRGEIWWSESHYTRFGYPEALFETESQWLDRIHPGDNARVATSFHAAVEGVDSEWQEQYRYRRGDGSYATVLDRGFVLRDATGRPVRVVGGMLDISDRQNYEDQLAYRATHDELTGLPNRQLLQDRLQQALFNAQRYGRSGTLIFIDLDDFKLVNDSLGHSVGDRVLGEVASRLRAVARATDTVARFGGDEFVIILTEQEGDAGAADVIARIGATLAVPLHIGDTQHTVTSSIGWCRFPEAGADVDTLLMHGDLAMYQAKRQGRNRAVEFHSDFVEGISRRLHLVSQLRLALERDEFIPVFQPLFDRDENPVALEALLRWHHPERGIVLPGEFIAVCEESGLIVDVGRRVLHQAAKHYRLLADAGLGHLRIAVNVSPAQFNDGLVEHVREAMQAHGVPAEILELEITEGLLMSNPERAIELMRQITALGVTFSVDDFGTGYSSLAYLKRFPIDRLKIDRSFVRDLGIDDDDAAICNSIIGLAHALDIRTVAEGVETTLQLDWLRTRSIDEVQGFLLGRPLPFAELLPLLKASPAARRKAAGLLLPG